MTNNSNILNDTLFNRCISIFANYNRLFDNDDKGQNNKYTGIKNLRYNFLLRLDSYYIDEIPYDKLVMLYEMLVNLLGDNDLNKDSWRLIFNGFNIDVTDKNLEHINDFFNNGYVKNYIENIYELWQLLYKLEIEIHDLEFSIFLIFGFNYFYDALLQKDTEREKFPFLFIIKLLSKKTYSNQNSSFIMFLNDLLEENEQQIARYLMFEQDLVLNSKSKRSRKALYVLMSYGGYAENSEIRKHILNTAQSINRLFTSIMQIDSNIVSIARITKEEDPHHMYNYFKSNFIQNFLSKGIQ